MVWFLHSGSTGSRNRANVTEIITKIIARNIWGRHDLREKKKKHAPRLNDCFHLDQCLLNWLPTNCPCVAGHLGQFNRPGYCLPAFEHLYSWLLCTSNGGGTKCVEFNFYRNFRCLHAPRFQKAREISIRPVLWDEMHTESMKVGAVLSGGWGLQLLQQTHVLC